MAQPDTLGVATMETKCHVNGSDNRDVDMIVNKQPSESQGKTSALLLQGLDSSSNNREKNICVKLDATIVPKKKKKNKKTQILAKLDEGVDVTDGKMTQLTYGTHEPDQIDKVASYSRNEAKKSPSNRSETDHVSEQQSLLVRRINKNQKNGKCAKICEASKVTNEEDASIGQATQAKSTQNAVERQVRDFDVSQPEAEKYPDHSVFNVAKEQSDAKQTMNEETQSESRCSYITPGFKQLIGMPNYKRLLKLWIQNN